MPEDNGRVATDADAFDEIGDGSGAARRQAHAERDRAHRIGSEPIRAMPADRKPRRAEDDEDAADDDESDDDDADGDDEPKPKKKPKAKQHSADDDDDADNNDDADDDDDVKKDDDKPKKWSTAKRVAVGLIVLSVLLVAGAIALIWWLEARHFESTDDAFVDAHYEMLAPQVGGRVLKVYADDNALVKPGETVLEIDPADFQVAIERARANVAEAEGQIAQAKAQQDVAAANVEQAQADVAMQQSTLDNAQAEFKRYEGLSKEAVSPQRLDDLRTAQRNAAAQLTAAQKRAVSQQAQVEFAASQITAAQATAKAARAQQSQAELNLSYATVKATTGGRVAQRNVQAGDYVTPGQRLLILVPSDVFVTANYKETQITDMRPGQPVDIAVDAFPDQKFTGKIDSIQRGSGTIFSLLPPQNATGNYVKVVQRVPVKIVFDQNGSDAYERLGPGMSVVPAVRVR